MLKSLLTSGSILELFSRMSFKHSVNVISNVVKGIKNQGIKNDNGGQVLSFEYHLFCGAGKIGRAYFLSAKAGDCGG